MSSGLRARGKQAARVETVVAVSHWVKGGEDTATVMPPQLCLLHVPLRILEPGPKLQATTAVSKFVVRRVLVYIIWNICHVLLVYDG